MTIHELIKRINERKPIIDAIAKRERAKRRKIIEKARRTGDVRLILPPGAIWNPPNLRKK